MESLFRVWLYLVALAGISLTGVVVGHLGLKLFDLIGNYFLLWREFKKFFGYRSDPWTRERMEKFIRGEEE